VEFVASGDKVVAVGNYAGISNATGQSLTADWVMVWTFRDGMVTRFQEYTDTLATHYAITSRAAA
jgi:ketosteroid isomerase-like protein